MRLKDISPQDAALVAHTEMVLTDDADPQLASIKKQQAQLKARTAQLKANAALARSNKAQHALTMARSKT
jgi:hypothetical protein